MDRIGVVKTLLLLLTAVAGAASAEPAPLLTNADAGARLHFSRGVAFYDAGRYAEAVREFEAAGALEAIPAIDYDVARAYDRMGRAHEAAEAYGRFVAAVPDDRDAPAARARMEELMQQVASSAPIAEKSAIAAPTNDARAVVEHAPAAPPVEAPHRQFHTWIAGGAGAMILAGALAAGLIAHARRGELADRCAPDGACDLARVPDAQALIDGGKTAAVASDVLLGIGAAVVVAGAAIYFVDRRERYPATRIAPAVGAHGAGLVMGGAW